MKARNTHTHLSHHHRHKQFHLKRELGLLNATVAGVGVIIGAGIYVLIGAAAGLAGTALWMPFLISAIVAFFTGLSYAELSSLFPRDAGEYLYVEKASNRFCGFVIGYLVLLTAVITAAAVSLGFAGYFSALFKLNVVIPIAIAIIALLSFVNFIGITHSRRLNLFLGIFEVGGLLFIIFFGARFIGSTNYLIMPQGIPGVLSATALIFFAFAGFEAIVKLSEETKHARTTIPRALILAITITTILYTLVGLTAVSVVGWEELSHSAAPLATVAEALVGSKAFVILAIVALFSTANTMLITLVASSRMFYGLGEEIPRLNILSRINKRTATPHLAIVITFILSGLFIFFGKKIDLVASISNFAIFVTFFAVNISAIILRYRDTRKRAFRMPLNIGRFPLLPLFGALFCIFMIITLPLKVVIFGSMLILIGILIYFVLIQEQKHKKGKRN